MDKRTAKRLRDEDDTPYTVASRAQYESRIRVTGYASAQAVRNSAVRRGEPAAILTQSETERLGRKPFFTTERTS